MNCRLCRREESGMTPMVKYSVRHYAHWDCFLASKGEAGLRELPTWKIGQCPYKILVGFKLESVASQIVNERRREESR